MTTVLQNGGGLERSTVNVKRLQSASRSLEVIPADPERGVYVVASASERGRFYRVALERDRPAGSCSCTWAQYGGVNCKHVLAALRAHYAVEGSLSFWRTRADARRQHRRIVVGDRLYATLRPRRR